MGWLNETWFKLGIAVALIVAATAFYQGEVVIPRERAKHEVADQAQQQLIQNQSSCSNLEKKVLAQYLDNNPTVLHSDVSTQNHFNVAKNRCFVEVSHFSCAGSSCSTLLTLYDALENRTIAYAIRPTNPQQSFLDYYEDDSENGTLNEGGTK